MGGARHESWDQDPDFGRDFGSDFGRDFGGESGRDFGSDGRRFTDEERLRSHPVTDDPAAAGPLTDADAAFLRHLRFGELPARVRPAEQVQMVDRDIRQEVPEQAFDARVWGENGRVL